jgi:hypothetical protein
LSPTPTNASGALYVNAKKDAEYEVARRAREEIRKQAAEEAKKEKEEKEEKEKKEKEEKEENNKQEEGQEEGQEKEKEEEKEEGKEAAAAAPPPPSVSAETDVAATLPVVMPTSTVPASAMKEEEINAILTMEENMVKVDQELKAIEDSKNALESFVYGDQFLFIVHVQCSCSWYCSYCLNDCLNDCLNGCLNGCLNDCLNDCCCHSTASPIWNSHSPPPPPPPPPPPNTTHSLTTTTATHSPGTKCKAFSTATASTASTPPC